MSFKKLVDATMKHSIAVIEDSPPGFKGTVKAMKKDGDVDNPYALAWWMKNKGYESHKKASGAVKEGTDFTPNPNSYWAMSNKAVTKSLAYIKQYYPDVDYENRWSGQGENKTWVTASGATEGIGKDPYTAVKDFLARNNLDTMQDIISGGLVESRAIRINHPVHGNGTVEAITETDIEITWDNLDKRLSAPNTVAFSEAKYLTRIREEYTDDPEDAEVGRKKEPKMVKNSSKKRGKKRGKKVTESMVAIGMAAIGGTHRGNPETLWTASDEILRFDDLLEYDDDWNKPWNEDEGDDDTDTDTDNSGEGTENRSPDKDTTKGADYTNVPRPADSVLTNQEDQQSYSADPLSTKAGFDAAGDGGEPDGDYQDINPTDAPDTPQVRDLEGSSDRGNTRDTGGDSDDTSEVDAGDYDESKPEDNGGEKKMKKESAWLTADDLGINLMEAQIEPGYDDDMAETHDTKSGEVGFTPEFLHKLFVAISAQAPDEAKVQALCDGLKSVSSESGATLDVADWDAIKSAAASAYEGGGMEGDDMEGDDMGGDDYEGDDMEGGDLEGDDYEGDDMEGDDMEGDEFEDKAVGDGDVAGPEGGDEHEGKTKMMDCDGCDGDDMNEKKVDQEGRPRGERPGNDRNRQSMKRRSPRKSQQYENKGGTPVGTGSTSGSGGGSQQDLSKTKSYKGKPVGTGTSGAGGSNANEFGQKPTKDGGSNNLPEYESGSQLGADSTTFSSDAESPAPRNSKALAAEGRRGKKGKQSRKKINEAICLGMSSIPGTIRGDHSNVPTDADWDDELKMIKRRAGMDNWWK